MKNYFVLRTPSSRFAVVDLEVPFVTGARQDSLACASRARLPWTRVLTYTRPGQKSVSCNKPAPKQACNKLVRFLRRED